MSWSLVFKGIGIYGPDEAVEDILTLRASCLMIGQDPTAIKAKGTCTQFSFQCLIVLHLIGIYRQP